MNRLIIAHSQKNEITSSEIISPHCVLPCTSLLAKPKQKKLGQIIAWHNSSSFDQGHLYASLLRYVCLCNFQCCYLFELCILCAVCVHLNVVGSRYANLALLCILLPHELPPCVCTKIWVQNNFEFSLAIFFYMTVSMRYFIFFHPF
jgi:hypothetical protein